jgi:hypothetical protein
MRLDLVEYYPSTRGDDVKYKSGVEYLGVIERASDGFTVLSIRSPGAARAHNIEVGQVYAITLKGCRYVLKTPWGRWRVRAAEIKHLIDGELDEWAVPYLDPDSPKFYEREADYEDQTDADAERAYRRRFMAEVPPRRGASAKPEPGVAQGCAVILLLGAGGLLGAIAGIAAGFGA